MKKIKKYFLGGYEASWSAKSYYEIKFGPFLSKEERKKLGIRFICGCEWPSDGELAQGGRGSIELYAVKVPPEIKEIELEEPYVCGCEGYDVSLLDPWDQNPRDHYKKEYTESRIVLLSEEVPSPCRECGRWKQNK
jgi:hypothetical protein